MSTIHVDRAVGFNQSRVQESCLIMLPLIAEDTFSCIATLVIWPNFRHFFSLPLLLGLFASMARDCTLTCLTSTATTTTSVFANPCGSLATETIDPLSYCLRFSCVTPPSVQVDKFVDCATRNDRDKEYSESRCPSRSSRRSPLLCGSDLPLALVHQISEADPSSQPAPSPPDYTMPRDPYALHLPWSPRSPLRLLL